MRWNTCFLLLVNQAIFCLTVNTKSDEDRLFSKLLDNYNYATRPVLNASNAVNVGVSVQLVQILGMDAENQILNTHIWLQQIWKDESLHWNPNDFNGLEDFRIPSDSIWVPDLVLLNSADDFKAARMQSNTVVNYNGSVYWSQSLKLRSSCAMDIQNFPFDIQICALKFSSWSYNGHQMILSLSMGGVDDISDYYFTNTEWKLIEFKAKRNAIIYACCDETFMDITVLITIQRMPLYYFYNIIIPCAWLTILNLLVFLLPPDSGDKISLGITIFLAFSVFMLVISDKVPINSHAVPLIGFYLSVTMGMTSLSLIMTVFTLNLHHVGPHRAGVPRWLQILTSDVLARLLCLKPTVYPFQRNNKKALIKNDENEIADENTDNHLHHHYDNYSMKLNSNEIINEIGDEMSEDKRTKDDITMLLDILVDKQRSEARQQTIIEEWRFVASVLDRLLFWLFLITCIIYSVLILYSHTKEWMDQVGTF